MFFIVVPPEPQSHYLKKIKDHQNPELMMHHITFQKGKLFQLKEESIKHR